MHVCGYVCRCVHLCTCVESSENIRCLPFPLFACSFKAGSFPEPGAHIFLGSLAASKPQLVSFLHFSFQSWSELQECVGCLTCMNAGIWIPGPLDCTASTPHPCRTLQPLYGYRSQMDDFSAASGPLRFTLLFTVILAAFLGVLFGNALWSSVTVVLFL